MRGATRGSMRPSPGAFGATLSPLRGARDLKTYKRTMKVAPWPGSLSTSIVP